MAVISKHDSQITNHITVLTFDEIGELFLMKPPGLTVSFPSPEQF